MSLPDFFNISLKIGHYRLALIAPESLALIEP
jgi:hypothetical protein